MKKKTNKRDLTERNARAYNKRLKALELKTKKLEVILRCFKVILFTELQ